MNIAFQTTALSSSVWRRAFADALIKLRPDMNPDAVDELSDAAHLRHADMLPVEAAALHHRGDGVWCDRPYEVSGRPPSW